MAIFKLILREQLKTLLITWSAVLMVVFILEYFVMSNDPEQGSLLFMGWFFGFVISIATTKAQFFQERYSSVLKSNSRNIFTFWSLIFFQNLILLGLCILVFPLLNAIKVVQVPPLISQFEYLGGLVIVFMYMCFMDSLQLVDRIQRNVWAKKEMLKLIISILVISIVIFFLAYMYIFSPLAAIASASLFALSGFIFRGDDFVKSVPLKSRLKFLLLGSAAIAVFQLLLAIGDQKFSKNPTYVVRHLKPWSYDDIKAVKSIEGWIAWQNKLSSLKTMSAEQLIASYELLTQLCPPTPRDAPLTVHCVGEPGLTDFQTTGKDSRSEEDVLKLMSASTEYAQIMGLLYARKLLKPLSKDVILAIEYIAEKESTIQGMARNTLTQSYPQNYIGTLRIQTE